MVNEVPLDTAINDMIKKLIRLQETIEDLNKQLAEKDVIINSLTEKED